MNNKLRLVHSETCLCITGWCLPRCLSWSFYHVQAKRHMKLHARFFRLDWILSVFCCGSCTLFSFLTIETNRCIFFKLKCYQFAVVHNTHMSWLLGCVAQWQSGAKSICFYFLSPSPSPSPPASPRPSINLLKAGSSWRRQGSTFDFQIITRFSFLFFTKQKCVGCPPLRMYQISLSLKMETMSVMSILNLDKGEVQKGGAPPKHADEFKLYLSWGAVG